MSVLFQTTAILVISVLLVIASVDATATGAEESFSPQAFYQKTVETWQRKYSRGSTTSWEVWKDFATTTTSRYESIVGKHSEHVVANAASGQPSAVDIVGSIEEGILTIERIIVQQQQETPSAKSAADDAARDAALAVLYREYGRLLWYSSETYTSHADASASAAARGDPQRHRCYELATDPHTLLIGAPERVKGYYQRRSKTQNKEALLASLFGPLCLDNAENALRNAVGMDASASGAEAKRLLEEITEMMSGGENDHKRKPKEFVAELFDSFADSFDEKLVKTLEYRVPQIIGSKVGEIIGGGTIKGTVVRNVLDAGCGTGLAGRELRNALDDENSPRNRITLVGVDASPKMLQIAGQCTASRGCGMPPMSDSKPPKNDPKLYDALLEMDLEEMTLENTLRTVARTSATATAEPPADSRFDVIVAADVFVYFGSLERILEVFSGLQTGGGILVFTCEKATAQEAPLGHTLMPTGRFAHTRDHVVKAASASDYSLLDYSEIVPRTEKGVAVNGHLFVFSANDSNTLEAEL